MKLFLKILVPVTVLSLAAAGAYALVKSKPEPERRSAEEKSWVVEAETVLISDERPDLTLFGEVVAGRKVDMRPLIAGRIVAVGQNFVEGGIVRHCLNFSIQEINIIDVNQTITRYVSWQFG